MKNLLITSAGKRVVLTQIFQKSTKELGLDTNIYTVDLRPELAPACIISDGYFTVPKCTDENYVDRLIELCIKMDVGIVVPTIDTELIVLASNKERFQERGISLVLSDLDFIKLCRDKRLTKDYLTRFGLATPKAIDKFHPVYPMFVKPYDGSRSYNTHVIQNKEDLTMNILEDPKLMFMEYISTQEYKEFTVDMYYGKDSMVKGIVPRERIEIRSGEINKGITRKNYIVGFLKEKMEYLEGVHGCICLQLFYRENDHDIKCIEINPRFGGGYPLSYYAKANFAEYVIREYLMGETIDYSDSWLDNTLMLRYDNDVIVYDANA